VLALPVKFYEPARQVLQRASRRELVVDEGAASALRRDLPADEQLFPAGLEDGLDGGGVLTRADQVARGAVSEQQTDSLDENRLAGAGFACQHIEARRELDLDRIDDRQPFDAKEPEHGERERTPILT